MAHEGAWVQFDRAHNDLLDIAVAGRLPALFTVPGFQAAVLGPNLRLALHHLNLV